MKRVISLVLISLVLVSSIFAAEAGKLTVWCSDKQVDILKRIGSEFEARFGVPVVVQEVPFGDIKTKFLTAAPAGEGPDIIVTAHDQIGELVTNGLVIPFDFMKDRDKQIFMKTALDAFDYEGKLYGLPYAIEAIALIYNKDYLEDADMSMEDFQDLAEEWTSEEFRGFVYDAGNFYFSAPLLFANGGYVFKKTATGLDAKDIGLANAGAVKGGEVIRAMFDRGVLKPGDNYSIMDGLFKDGMAMAIINGPWAIPDYKRAGIDYGIAPIPAIAGKPATPFTGVQGFLISSKTPNKLFAIDFLTNYVNTKEVMYRLYMADPRVPTRSDVLELVKNDPDVVAFFKSANNGVPMPNIPAMNAVWGAMGDALSQIINKQLQPADALTQAVEKIRAAIGN